LVYKKSLELKFYLQLHVLVSVNGKIVYSSGACKWHWTT